MIYFCESGFHLLSFIKQEVLQGNHGGTGHEGNAFNIPMF
jgi:hypothetical protein